MEKEQETFFIRYDYFGLDEYYLVTSSLYGVALNNEELVSAAREIVKKLRQERKAVWWANAKQVVGGYPKTDAQWQQILALPDPNLSIFPCSSELLARAQFARDRE